MVRTAVGWFTRKTSKTSKKEIYRVVAWESYLRPYDGLQRYEATVTPPELAENQGELHCSYVQMP
jgi:hypothetical protein